MLSGYRMVILTALFAFGSAAVSGQEQEAASSAEPTADTAESMAARSVETPLGEAAVQDGWNSTPCNAGGIYRPFSLIRQLKLATAYVVNPALPESARLVHAYNLESAYQSPDREVWIERISEGEVQLAAPVENDVAGALSPVQLSVGVDGTAGTTVLSPCRPLAAAESDDGTPRIIHVAGTDGQPDSWIEGLPQATRKRVHLLSFGPNPISDTDSDRLVTWDPTEGVAESRSPERGR
ncbi:MAG: hypothetical protein OXQ28_06905 [Acidobacteriota bacterium]|nr:hypothetical protein [Acidobacteriota bacterium]